MLENRLTTRVNKHFSYVDENDETHEIKIEQFYLKSGIPTVFTDKGPLDFIDLDEFNSWVNLLKEIPGPDPSVAAIQKHQAKPQNAVVTYEPKIGGDVLSKAKDVLFDNIEKLKGEGGADFIPQAQQINKEVNTIIDLAKTEVELIKVIKS